MSLFLLLSLLLVSYLIPHKYQVHSQYSFPPVIMEINSKKTFKAKVIRNDTLSKIYKHGNTLEQLDLSGCGIRKLPENLFNCLQNLKIIDLRQNFLIGLPPSLAFHQNIEVQKFIISCTFRTFLFRKSTWPKTFLRKFLKFFTHCQSFLSMICLILPMMKISSLMIQSHLPQL